MRVLALALLAVAVPRLESADLPASPAGVVADSARLFTEADRLKLEAFGAESLQQRGVVLRVLTLQDANGESPKSIAVRALNQWRVGPKSVLLLILVNPRSLYLQPGTALASTFDAATSAQICSSVVAPPMRAKAPGAAALAGFGAIRDRLARPLTAGAAPSSSPSAARAAAVRAPARGPSGEDALTFAVKTFHLDIIGGLALAGWPLFWIFSKVFARKCPDCAVRMNKDRRVIEPSTFQSTGLGERIFTCVACGHVETEAYQISKRAWGYDSSGETSDGGSWDSSSSSSSSGSSDGGSSSDGSGGGGSDY